MKELRVVIAFCLAYLRRIVNRLTSRAGVVAIIVIIIGLSLLRLASDQGLFKPTISQGIVGTYREEDLPILVNQLLSEGLVTDGVDGSPQPNLAKDWQVNNQATIFTFKLKDNLSWSDGSQVKAVDIELPLTGVETKVIDDTTLEFHLTDSFGPFPSLLNKPIFKKNSQRKADSDSSHLGIGPYRVASVFKDQVFVRKLILKSVDPALPDVVIRLYPNERIAKNALKLGEVQALLGVNDPVDLQQRHLAIWSKTNYQQLVAVFYNTSDKVISDPNLRLALSFAAPQIKDEVEATTPIAPTSWAFEGQVKDFLDKPDQAKLFLQKVGNWEEIKKNHPVVTLTATPFLKNVGERVVEAWNRVGIRSVLRVESGVPQQFQALLIAQNIPADPDQYSLWHSTQTRTNLTKFASPRVDKDLEDGRKSTSVQARIAKYADFQKELLDSAPVTPLYFPQYHVVYMKKVEESLMKVLQLQLPNFN